MVTSLTTLLFVGTSALFQDNVNPQTATLQDFEKRISDYVSMQKNLAKGISATKPTTEPQLILERQHELARKIREARSTAQQGAIFSPEIMREFHRLIGLAMQGTNSAKARMTLTARRKERNSSGMGASSL